jgi:hypothetical protein
MRGEGVRALLCQHRHRLEAEDDKALLAWSGTISSGSTSTRWPPEGQIREIVSTRAFDFEYETVGYKDEMGPDEKFRTKLY